MPADIEIHFGFIGPKAICDAFKALNMDLVDYDERTKITEHNFSENSDFDYDANDHDQAIKEAYEAIVTRLGWTIKDFKKDYLSTYILDTPYGLRETHPFGMNIQYDTGEIGDEIEDASFGIRLSARYRPCILDIENPHGGLRPTVPLDDLQPVIEICKEEIIKRIPVFKNAKIYIRHIFY